MFSLDRSKKQSLYDRAVRLLTSVKLCLVLFSFLALAAAAGSLLPQGEEGSFYLAHYGDLFGRLIVLLGLDRVYRSGWFILAGGLLFLNLLACTVRRTAFAAQQFRGPGQSRLVRFTRLGSPVLHAGLLVLAVGIFLGAVYGKSLSCRVPEGEAADLTPAGFPFDLRVDRFAVEYYPDFQPKQYRTELTVVENGQEVYGKTIAVNDPLHYRGVKVYQASYGWVLEGTIEEDGRVRPYRVFDRNGLTLDKAEEFLAKMYFFPDYAVREDGHPYLKTPLPANPKLVYLVFRGRDLIATGVLAPGEKVALREGLVLNFTRYRYFTGLQVKRDPGLPFVWSGFGMVLLGLALRYIQRMSPGRRF